MMAFTRRPTDSEIFECIKEATLEASVGTSSRHVVRMSMGDTLARLGIDSLSTREIVAALEERLGMHLPDHQLVWVSTIRDLVSFVSANLDLAAGQQDRAPMCAGSGSA